MTQIEQLLKNGADANTKDHKGFSLLMKFAKEGDIPSMRALLAYGARINDRDYFSYSALDYAIIEGHLDVVKFLLEDGAKISHDSYMLAVRQNMKHIVHYFDSLDQEKQIFIKKK
ncbi:MAG: ankyrin repeat domain-containing protein [Campylobacterales bacterium]|nr:ankyrin repeat domain-containing protein [Campylobacterales bacterium]